MRSIVVCIVSSVLLLTSCADQSSLEIFPIELRCEYDANPLGVEAENPRLGWMLISDLRDQKQTAYQILVASSEENLKANTGDLWNSGRVDSEESIHIMYEGEKLSSGLHCFWKVKVWDQDNRLSDWSEPAFWEMGLLNQEDWKAKWIGYNCPSAPMLRKEFMVDKPIKEARVYISGLGYYELSINGSKVSENVLDPGQTDYEQRAFYVIYDVTDIVKKGSNAVGVILGNGWYHQTVVKEARFGWGDADYGEPRLIFQMRILHDDGSETLIVSDDNWHGSAGPIVSNNIYAGESYDARLEQTDWNFQGFDDSGWGEVQVVDGPGGILVSQKLPPIKRMQLIKPVDLSNPESGIYVYDMGQNFSGWAKLNTIEAEAGTAIQLRFAESLHENGMIDPASTGGYATYVTQTDKYICKGTGAESWEPRFTYHGFRYVEMTGFPGKPGLENLEGIVVYTAVDKAGSFECSDEMLNRIHKTALWTQVGNMHSVPTDCPHRERCGWLGDAHLCAEMSIYNLDVPLFWLKYIRDIQTSSNNGIPNNIAPGRRTGGMRDDSQPDWASASILLPWYMYLYYGDKWIVYEHWGDMTGLMDHLKSLSKDNIIYMGYGDMFAPGSVYPIKTPVELTSTAFFYFDAKIMTVLSAALGKLDESDKYNQLAEDIKSSFNNHFYNEKDKTYGSQTADCLALYLGLAPKPDESDIAMSLARSITDQYNGHHATGIFGSRHLYWVLSRYGYGDIAQGMLNQTTYPSIGDLFNRGATTFWEYWGEREIDETSLGTRSKSHPFQGAYDAWFFNGIAGINPDPDNPGFKHIILQPQMIGNLTFAKAQYASIYGPIKSEWQVSENTSSWFVSIPVNTRATVYIPTVKNETVKEGDDLASNAVGVKFIKVENGSTVYDVGSGDYTFTWEP